MTRYFMRDTPLFHLEQQMMTPPNFKPRGHGLRRPAFRYANRVDLERNLPKSDKSVEGEEYRGYAVSGHGGMVQTPAQEKSHKYGKGMKTFEKEEL